MPGAFEDQGQLFSYISPEQRGRGTASTPYNTGAGARGAQRAGPRLPQTIFNPDSPQLNGDDQGRQHGHTVWIG